YFVMPALNRAFDHFWANDPGPGNVGLQDRFAQAWTYVAQHFVGNPAVLGYDVFNEPWPGTQWPTCVQLAGCPVFDEQMLAPFMTKVINAIRTADSTHIAFYEPNVTFDYSVPTYMGKVGDSLSAMSFHVYCLAALGFPEIAPARGTCDYVEARTVSNAEAQSVATGDALLLTEFGATTDTVEIRSVIDLADSHSVPWVEWAYCSCDDPTGSGQSEALVLDPTKPPTGSNVNTTTLRALDEP